MTWTYSDGGRRAAGFRGDTGDCVTRAIAIATGKPYSEVYEGLHAQALGDRAHMAKLQRHYGANARRHASPRDGVPRRVYDAYLTGLGWRWTPTMRVGQGCTVHLRADELPAGRLVVRVSGHMCAVIDGVAHDIEDPRRDGTRCVYGYWTEGDTTDAR